MQQQSGWVRYALTSFLLFGITNFLLGAIAEMTGRNPQASITAPMLLWIGMGLMGGGAVVIFRVRGRGFRGIPAPRFAVIAAVAGITLALGMLTLKIGLAREPLARGPIVAVTSANSIIVALLALVVLREKLSGLQLAGLLTIVAGIGIMAAGGRSATGWGAILFGLLTMLLFGITNFLLKYAGHHRTDSISATAILWISAGVFGLLAVGVSFGVGRGLAGLETWPLRLLALVTGLFLGGGMLALKLAVSRGPGGPATAITGSNAVLVTLLDRLVFGHLPPLYKIVGMVVALVGIAVLALGQRRRAPVPGEKS